MCGCVFVCSYDSVVPLGELGCVVPEPAPPTPRQWLVSSRWLKDLDHFNEWMNEEDYQLIVVVRMMTPYQLMCSLSPLGSHRMNDCCRLPLT